MAETGEQAPNTAASQEQQPQITSRILTQFVRDMSFENILAQKGVTGDVSPDIQVKVNLDAKKRDTEKQYEVALRLDVTSVSKVSQEQLFLLEIDYVGIFQIDNISPEQLHPYMLIECPRLLFPFLRRIVSDVTRDGGFPPLNLENIDFLQLYRTEVERRRAEMSNTPQS